MKKLIKEKPLVSIIVPVYNGERFLRESLDSIVNQTYPHIEILVMDDASTDLTSKITADYGDRIRYIRQQQNKGIYNNANDGIEAAKGEYIAIYHADDVYDARIVEKEVEFLENHPEIGAVFCKDIFVDAENREYGRLQLQPEVSGETALSFPVVLNVLLKYKNLMFVCPTAMVRAAVYRNVGMYRQEKFFNTSDLEMWLRIAQKYPVAILEEYLLRYRHFEGQSSRRYHRLRTEAGRFFTIMDLYLRNGAPEIADAKSLNAYEGHRAEDFLMITVNAYVLKQMNKAKKHLSNAKFINLLKGHRIQRSRMLILFLMLQVLVRLPRINFVANLFYQRWHVKDKKKNSFRWSNLFSNGEWLLQDELKKM